MVGIPCGAPGTGVLLTGIDGITGGVDVGVVTGTDGIEEAGVVMLGSDGMTEGAGLLIIK